MKTSIAYKILFIISVLMLITAVAEIAFALFTGEILHWLTYAMIFLTIVNAALFTIIGNNLKSKVEKGENNR